MIINAYEKNLHIVYLSLNNAKQKKMQNTVSDQTRHK